MKLKLPGRLDGILLPPHGGSARESGMLDFSYSVNPFPLPETVYSAYVSAFNDIGRYPDTDAAELKEALAAAFGYKPESILVTNGSAEAFSLIASVLLDRGSGSAVFSPGYSDYGHVSKIAGAEIIRLSLDPAAGFSPDYERISDAIKRKTPRLTWVCNPHNPAGIIFSETGLKNFARCAAEFGGWIVIDEAYRAFVPGHGASDYSEYENVIIVRSMTKDYGIPGLRLGYIHGAPEVIRLINLCRPGWSVNEPAQRTGLALLAESAFFKASWEKTFSLRKAFIDGLFSCGIDPFKASANECGVFVFFKIPELSGNTSFLEALSRKRIVLRDCLSMGAPGYCRAGVRIGQDNDKLIEAAAEILRVSG